MNEESLPLEKPTAREVLGIAEPQPILTSIVPPSTITRNEYGLISNGSVRYFYTPEGLVDWRKMISSKHLSVNKQNFEKNSRPIPESIEGLDDRDLLILLPGIKELAQIRGYESVTYSVVSPTADYVVTSCTIKWLANFETENRSVTFSAIGDASPFNTNSFGKSYLGPIAENRAFVRAVRNFLKVNIVSQEEITPSPWSSASDTVDTTSEKLMTTMLEHGLEFEQIKTKLIKEGYEGAEGFKQISDIPKVKQFELITRIKKKAAEKAAAEKK